MNSSKSHVLSQLSQFTGTEYYYPLWPKVLLTDGTKYLAETVGCYWLMDAIASHVMHLGSNEGFTSCSLTCTNGSGNLTITDGNGNVLAKQRIPYTDFPFNEISLYTCLNEDKWVILLPSEYQVLNTCMRFFEFQTPKVQKPLSPAQARLRSLRDQAKRAQAAIKAERARQKIQAGQMDLAKVESTHRKKSQSYKTIYKMNNPYTAWVSAGTYGDFNNALSMALRKKKAGAVAVQIVDNAKMVVYSS